MPIRSMPLSFVRFLQVFLLLLVPILLVIGPVRLLVTDPYLAFEYRRADFPPDPFGFSRAQRLALASANFRYVREGQPIEVLAKLRLGNTPLYSERELKHMQDVQNVYQGAMQVWQSGLLAAVFAVSILAWRAETRPVLAAALKWSGLLTFALISGIGLLAVVAWQFWFVAFHQIFFAPGTWMFNQWDTLIRLFPSQFWFDAALAISGLSLGGSLLLAALGWRWQSGQAAVSPRLSTSPS